MLRIHVSFTLAENVLLPWLRIAKFGPLTALKISKSNNIRSSVPKELNFWNHIV